ncbi:MAG: hypothetical protein GWN58_38175 [Anaerolineae bacterium]|nr:hypothetical protein [Anaerolineae bacterium]
MSDAHAGFQYFVDGKAHGRAFILAQQRQVDLVDDVSGRQSHGQGACLLAQSMTAHAIGEDKEAYW